MQVSFGAAQVGASKGKGTLFAQARRLHRTPYLTRNGMPD